MLDAIGAVARADDFRVDAPLPETRFEVQPRVRRHELAKRAFDIVVCTVLLVPLVLSAIVLWVLNPVLNPGPLLFSQTRMGLGCRPFTAYKFRSMTEAPTIRRGAYDALDADRITRLGALMRKLRIDELPQIINVFRGEMSLIGPRPDFYDHACVYVEEVRGYLKRHTVKPGISGFAQTKVGYVNDHGGVRRKVAADIYYIRYGTFRMDMWIAWQTLLTVLGRKGA